jgi:competence CoiA-like predicted nuclease
MLYAKNINGVKISPEKNIEARCFGCDSLMVAKMGMVMLHHWAHLTKKECDIWMENEGEWHLGWKKLCEEHSKINDITIEKFIKKENIWHFADIYSEKKGVTELQHSPISVQDIQAREQFYGKMVWLFDCREAYKEGRLTIYYHNTYHTFTWKHPKKTIDFVRKPVFFDIGDNKILQISKTSIEGKMYGWGQIIDYKFFITTYVL